MCIAFVAVNVSASVNCEVYVYYTVSRSDLHKLISQVHYFFVRLCCYFNDCCSLELDKLTSDGISLKATTTQGHRGSQTNIIMYSLCIMF